MDSVDKAFEDLMVLRMCLKRIHWFSPGIVGREFIQDVEKCIEFEYWWFITLGLMKPGVITSETLFRICRIGRVDAIRSIVSDYKVDVNSSDSYGWMALHFATLYNHPEAIAELQTLGAIDIPTSHNIAPSDMRPELFGQDSDTWVISTSEVIAIEEYCEMINQSTEMFLFSLPRRLIRLVDKYGPKSLVHESHINSICSKYAIYLIGARKGWVWICHLCLELGIDINRPSIYGNSMLYEACREGNLKCIQFLLDHGADPNDTNQKGSFITPLAIACQRGDIECFHLLLAKGADPMVEQHTGKTLLHIACRGGNVDCVQFCLDRGMDVNKTDKNNSTPLHIACGGGHTECVRLLLEQRPQADIYCRVTGLNPLHCVCDGGGHTETVRLLVEYDITLVNTVTGSCQKRTPLWMLCFRGNSESVAYLLEKGADPNQTVEPLFTKMTTPLLIACDKGHSACVSALLQNGADVLLSWTQLLNPLIIACEKGFDSCVDVLREYIRRAFWNFRDQRKYEKMYILLYDVRVAKVAAQQNGHMECYRLIDTTFRPIDTEYEQCEAAGYVM